MFGNNGGSEMQRSAGTILCCLATASDKINNNFEEVRQIPIIRAYI